MSADDAIGGYFPLEVASGPGSLPDGLLGFQSARAAFLALLRHVKPKRVWLPRYLCPAMLRAVQAAGVEARLYSLGDQFQLRDFYPGPRDAVLVVDYFGLTDEAVSAAVNQFGADRVIVDAAQSWSIRADAVAKIFSLRKFRAVPDGGVLITDLPVPLPEIIDQGSPGRCLGMLLRADGQNDDGYAAYLNAEASLNDMEPRRMSTITARMAMAADFSDTFWKRRNNYGNLAARLADLAETTLPCGEYAPLCFPLIGVDALRLRPILAAQRIYTPTYWPDIVDAGNLNAFELTLRDRTLYLPIDQRYGSADMERLAEAVRAAVRGLGTKVEPAARHAI